MAIITWWCPARKKMGIPKFFDRWISMGKSLHRNMDGFLEVPPTDELESSILPSVDWFWWDFFSTGQTPHSHGKNIIGFLEPFNQWIVRMIFRPIRPDWPLVIQQSCWKWHIHRCFTYERWWFCLFTIGYPGKHFASVFSGQVLQRVSEVKHEPCKCLRLVCGAAFGKIYQWVEFQEHVARNHEF